MDTDSMCFICNNCPYSYSITGLAGYHSSEEVCCYKLGHFTLYGDDEIYSFDCEFKPKQGE
jgi:hypothetical protein